MSVRRTLAGAAVAVLLVHVVVIAWLGTGPSGVLWSNVLQLTSSLLVTAAFVHAALRARDAMRRLCGLAAASFLVWSVAQGGWLFHELTQASVVPTVSPINILFFFFVAPLALAILLPVHLDTKEDLVPFALDFIQLTIVLVATYLYFFYSTAFWAGREPGLDEMIRSATDSRNWIITLGLVVRWGLSSRGAVRSFFGKLAVVFLIYSVGESIYFRLTPASTLNTGRWFDLVWTASFGLGSVFAATLPVGGVEEVHPATMRKVSRVAFQAVPALIPLLVLITAAHLAADQLAVAAVAVVVSFGVYTLRLVYTQRQAEKSADALRESEEHFRQLATAVSAGSGETFFRSLALHLCESVSVSYVIVAELKPGSQDTMSTLAVAKGREIVANFEYGLKGTPCASVMDDQPCYYPTGVAKLFPEDFLLSEMGVEAYYGVPLRSTSGQVLGLLVVLHHQPLPNIDHARSILQISATRAATELERIRADVALRASEEKFALAFRQSPDMVVMSSAVDHRFLEVNDGFVRFFGAPREEIIGKTGIELGMWMELKQREESLAELAQFGSFADREMSIRRKSGEVRTVMVSGGLLQIGDEPCLVVTARDVTDRNAAEEALRQSERNFRDLFENANDVIFTVDLGGRLLSLNKKGEAICGFSTQATDPRNLSEVLAPQDAERYAVAVARLVKGLLQTTLEVSIRNLRTTEAATVELALRPILQDGTAVAVQGIGRDISERRLLELKFFQAQKMDAIGTLAGGVAHDFNNLLTVITGYCHLAKTHLTGDSKAAADIGEIQEAANRAASLTSQLLAFSREQTAERAAVNLNASIETMERMLHRMIGEDIKLVTDLDPKLSSIAADPTQIDQVLMNLAVNSRDAMPGGGTLTFRTSRLTLELPDPRLGLGAGDYVVLAVEDTGTGIDARTLEHIFEPFFTTKEKGKGTGLGLSTVYGIVQQSGGEIAVASEKGRGTTFTLYFPADRRDAGCVEARQEASTVHGRETILLVEDNQPLQELCRRSLEEYGYRVLTANSVEEGRKRLQGDGRKVDLLVTDVVMPGGGGEEMAAAARELQPDIRVLYISGYTNRKLPASAALLRKPFSPESLAEKVRELLKPQPSERAG